MEVTHTYLLLLQNQTGYSDTKTDFWGEIESLACRLYSDGAPNTGLCMSSVESPSNMPN